LEINIVVPTFEIIIEAQGYRFNTRSVYMMGFI
jgi:hypothetical protein